MIGGRVWLALLVVATVGMVIWATDTPEYEPPEDELTIVIYNRYNEDVSVIVYIDNIVAVDMIIDAKVYVRDFKIKTFTLDADTIGVGNHSISVRIDGGQLIEVTGEWTLGDYLKIQISSDKSITLYDWNGVL